MIAACGGGDGDTGTAASSEADVTEPAEAPTDLTEEEVCALLDEDTVAAVVGGEVSDVRTGHTAASCDWWYKVEGGPTTNLSVQVMTMSQTSDRYGSEALEWAIDRAPSDVEVTQLPGLDAPHGSYEFSNASFTLALDQSGRVVTISVTDETPESIRAELVSKVLDALATNHA